MNNMHVVFGANGGAGKAIVHELLARGKQVRVVSRNGQLDKDIDAKSVEIVRGDATDIASAKAVCRDASVIYHAANVPYQYWTTGLPPMLDAIMQGAMAASAKLVYVDNTYLYGKVSAPMTEQTPPSATDHKGKLRASLANTLLQAHRNDAIQATIARGTNFYGPGIVNATLGGKALQAVLQGKKAMWLGRLDMPFSMTYIEDFAYGAVTLGERDAALGRAWHIPTAPALTGQQFLEILFAEAHMPPKIGCYTRPVMQLIGLFSPFLREVTGTLYQYESPYILDGSDYTRTFGDMTPTSPQVALRATLEWIRKGAKQQALPTH